MRYPVSRVKKFATPNAVKDTELSEYSHNVSGNKNGKPLWEIGCQFLINIHLHSIVFPDVYLREMKICIKRKPSRRLLKAILFIIVKTGNCSDVCSSVGEWANKLVYSYNRTLFRKKGLH